MVQPLGVISVVDAVIADLRERILTGDLVPGTALGEVETAAHYAVARPTVRAAIEALVSAGLLTRGAHKSARVTRLTPDDVADIYATRERIETTVVRALAETATRVDAAAQANASIRALDPDDALAIVEADMRFHTALIDAAASPRTSRVYRLLADEVRLCMVQTQSAGLLAVSDITAEHDALLAAIAERDSVGATTVLHSHLGRASERLMRHVAG